MPKQDYQYKINTRGPWLDIVMDREPPKATVDEIVSRLHNLERACLICLDDGVYLEVMHPILKSAGLVPKDESHRFLITMKYSVEEGRCVCEDCNKLAIKQVRQFSEWEKTMDEIEGIEDRIDKAMYDLALTMTWK